MFVYTKEVNRITPAQPFCGCCLIDKVKKILSHILSMLQLYKKYIFTSTEWYCTCSVFLRLLRVVRDSVFVVGAEGGALLRAQVYTCRGRLLQSVAIPHQPILTRLRLFSTHILLCPTVKPRLKPLVQAKRHLPMGLQQSKPQVRQQPILVTRSSSWATTVSLQDIHYLWWAKTFKSSTALYAVQTVL